MSTIVNENDAAHILPAVDAIGISVVTFTERELDDALHTVCAMHDMRHIAKPGHKQQPNSGRKFGPRLPTRLQTGIRLFSAMPASKVVDFFIMLLQHALNMKAREEESNGTTIFRDGIGVEHVLVQSFFVWLEFAEKRYRKGLPATTMETTNVATTSSNSAKMPSRNDCDGFRPSQRTPSPKGGRGGRQKQQRQKAGEHQQMQQQMPPESVDDEQQQPPQPNRQTNDMGGYEQPQQNSNIGTASSCPVPPCAPPSPHCPSLEPHVVVYLERVLITASQREQLVALLAPLAFPPRIHANIWKTVANVLELKNAKHFCNFVATVAGVEQRGRIGFDLLSFCLQNFADKMNFTSNHLVHALLLGPLSAATVEQFVANRPEEFRAKTRVVLLEAESWKFDENKWRVEASTIAHRSHELLPDFKEFCTNVTALMNELRNEISDQNNLIDPGWAHSLITTAARKLYTEKTWLAEHFDDLVHTLLVQRPTLKAFLLNVLLKDHHDRRAHEKWRNFVSSERYRMSKDFDMVNMCSKDEQTQFLSLPRHCEVYEIKNVHQFRIFERQFDEYVLKKTKRVLIGIDAEWNPYVARNRATLLQLALIHSVYLLDLDALHADKSFQQFIDRLFLNKSITKLGYQFGDDLAMLRIRLPTCIGLFRPQGIVCIGQLVEELNRRSTLHLPDFPTDKFLLPITDEQEEALKEHTRQIKPQRYNAMSANKRVKSPVRVEQPSSSNNDIIGPYDDLVEMYEGHDALGRVRRSSKHKCHTLSVVSGKSLADQGLAYLCRRVLGKPLDKQEQCSVWDRRPLRRRQVRYAALDAHCLMQIYHRCVEWSKQLELGGDPITLMSAVSQRFYAPLPLFCAFTVPNELLVSSSSPTDAKFWGNVEDEPKEWMGN